MKRQYYYRFILIVGFLLTESSIACDLCNCLRGINPYYTTSNGLSLHMLMQRSRHHHDEKEAALVADGPVLMNESNGLHHVENPSGVERRTTLELSYQHHLSEDLMATILTPYSFASLESPDPVSHNGMGDVTLLSHYIATTELADEWTGRFIIGGGVKFPTGKNSFRDPLGNRLDPHLQLGSGSTDVVLNGTFIVHHNAWSLALDAYGKLNTENKHGERLGNSIAGSIGASRELFRDNSAVFGIVGLASLRGEHAAKDVLNGIRDASSGFTSFYTNVGGQVYFQFLRLDVSLLIPVSQSRATGVPEEETRVLTGVRFEL